MNDASGHSGTSSGAETAQATWNRLGFAPANPYDGLSGAAGRSGASRSSKGSQEPPPAHSGSRPSAIHRTTYQAVQQAPSPQLPSQPRGGHTTHQSTPTTVYNTSVNQDLTPPTAHANAQRLAEIDIVQKLLLGGQKFCIDNSSGASRYVDSASIQAKQQLSRGGSHRDTVSNFNNQQVGYSISPQLIPQQAGRSVTVVRSMPQQLSYAESPALSNYSMSNYSDRGNASTQSYSSNSAAQMDSYDSISPPEQFAHGQAAAAAILVAQQSAAAALRAQQAARPVFPDMDMDNVHLHNQLQSHMSVAGAMGGNLDVNLLTIQALADSTTKPKRIRGGKGTSAVCTPTLSPGKVGSVATKTSVGQGAMAFASVPLDAAKDTGGDGDSMLVGRKKGKGKGKNRRNDNAPDPSYMNQEQLDNYNQHMSGLVAGGFNQLISPAFVQGSEYNQGGEAVGDFATGAYRMQQQQQQQSKLTGYQASLMMSQMSAMFDIGSVQRQEEPQVFMTNMYGSAFVNPNEVLPHHSTLDSAGINVLLGGGSNVLGGNGENDQAASESESHMQGGRLQTKAERKQRPVPQIIDEDFGHLTSDPNPGTLMPTVVKIEPAKTAAGTGFMDSFMSFVHGKKPDTLATAATAPTIKKPVLPKYIPDATPRRPPPPPPPPAVTTPTPKTEVKASVSASTSVQKQTASTSQKPVSLTAQKPTVSGGIKPLVSPGPKSAPSIVLKPVPSTGSKPVGSSGQYSPPMCKQQPPKPIHPPVNTPPAPRSRSRSKSQTPRRRRNKYSDDDDDLVDDDDAQSVEDGRSEEEEMEVVPTEVLPKREKSTRKAKEKVEEKRRASSQWGK